MQSLWSRAGQAHRCGCRACDSAVTGLGRRASTATRRRKPTFAEVFTACYSSVFATAAVVDAVRKEDRKQELDRQLDKARRELAELQELNAHSTAVVDSNQLSELTPEQMNELWRTLKTIYTNRPFMKEIDRPVTLRVSELLTRLKSDYYNCPDDATMQTLRKTDYERLERAIMAEEVQSIERRDAKTGRQLHNDTRTIVHLVRQLLKRADAHDQTSSPSPSFNEARELVEDGSVSYTFSTIDSARARKTTMLLNSHLRAIIHSPNMGLKEKVGRVCYNLMVSSYPPDMHTYNTLIVAFDKSGHKFLAEPFVNSFFHYRRLKPTTSTFAAILNHYKDTNNHGRFLRALACITGLDSETGAKVSRRHIEDVRDRLKWTEWAKDTEGRTLTGDWIWTHAPLDLHLVEVIMNGLLHFKLFDQAACFFVSCMRANIVLSTNSIKQLFDECIIALDWRAAVRLIRGFADCAKNWPTMLLKREAKAASYLINRLYVLLDICGLRTGDQTPSTSALANLDISSERFATFMESLAQTHTIPHLNLLGGEQTSEIASALSRSESRLLQIESLWREQAVVERTTMSIESKLLHSDFSPRFRQSMAAHIGETSTHATLRLSRDFTKTLGAYDQSPASNQLLGECQEFLEAMSNSGIEEVDAVESSKDISELDQGRPRADVDVEAEPSCESSCTAKINKTTLPGSEAVIVSEAGHLRTNPRRLLAWPVPAQRPVYAPRNHWAETG